MGGNASPEIADITLSVMKSHNANLPPHVRLFRYMDDILLLNAKNPINILDNIYKKTMEINVETSNNTSVNFLDLTISQNKTRKTYDIKVFNKRNNFPFYPILVTNYHSDVSKTILRGTLFTELTRYVRYSNDYMHFA